MDPTNPMTGYKPTVPNGVLPAPTHFAPAYQSIFTLTDPMPDLLENMSHVNCSYLSTPGVAPTLLQLKQHAHSLCVLIKYLTVNTIPGLINNAESEVAGAPTFSDGETWDFLNDLGRPYEGPKNDKAWGKHYNMPLTALLNVLQERQVRPGRQGRHNHHDHDMDGMDYDDDDDDDELAIISLDMCPLHSVHPDYVPDNQSSMPYATHQALISHANEVLELLDHEYSAKGGLLAILPPPEQTEDRAKAETTLLGQLIIYMQRLVTRVHDLERQYANAMDALAGEAVVPSQILSKLGPDGRAPREMVYPQDRFVLVNAGEDVWSFLHKQFEKKEVVDEYVAEENRKNGLSGPHAHHMNGGQEMSRGLTAVDITTRYYRLRKDPLKTIFVVPAHSEHPGTQTTIRMENEPTVVNVVKPVWPERASMWEMKNRAQLVELKQLRQEHLISQQTLQVKCTAETLLLNDNRLKDATITSLKNEIEQVKVYLSMPENKAQKELVDATAQVNGDRMAAAQAAADNLSTQAQLDALRADLDAREAALQVQTQQIAAKIRASEVAFDQHSKQLHAGLAAQDAVNGQIAKDLNKELEAAWRKRMDETETLAAYLREKAVSVTTDVATKAIIEAGKTAADDVVSRVVGAGGMMSPPRSSRSRGRAGLRGQ